MFTSKPERRIRYSARGFVVVRMLSQAGRPQNNCWSRPARKIAKRAIRRRLSHLSGLVGSPVLSKSFVYLRALLVRCQHPLGQERGLGLFRCESGPLQLGWAVVDFSLRLSLAVSPSCQLYGVGLRIGGGGAWLFGKRAVPTQLQGTK
jgi:hypothetical protein